MALDAEGHRATTSDTLQVSASGQLETLALLRRIVEFGNAALPRPIQLAMHDLRLSGPSGASAQSPDDRRPSEGASDKLHPPDTHNEHHQRRTSTLVIRDEDDQPFAALCFNVDVTDFTAVRRLADDFLKGAGEHTTERSGDPLSATPESGQQPMASIMSRDQSTEIFVHNVNDLATTLVRESIARVGVPVELMRKRHKLQVVAELQRHGLFSLREAADTVAAALDVTRVTIYNYLNEIKTDTVAVDTGASSRSNPEQASHP